ncbi:shikimate dehydrogenase [uncultured Microbacterium sp.]|uniref:shikimate dehydrogenase n=1 Tax=uncultured Microbacterium sp. TaxID=191216 RepID=UPI0028D2FE86|nr:shikimate dehydrogenase [uncultured Microbacterium sp.]
MTAHRLAVWGDPISHSRSPQLHAAAYRVLGLDWEYSRRQVDENGFAEALGGLDGSWRGLSLTMPLKEQARLAAESLDPHAELTGAVNTLLLDETLRGFNTDVGGIVDALGDEGLTAVDRVRILGAGATAASALVAAAEMGAAAVDVRARRPDRAAPLVALGHRLGLDVSARDLRADAEPVDLTIAALPGGASVDEDAVRALSTTGGALFDVAYSPWPSALAAAWGGGPAISGLGMLLHQAVRQIRVFLSGDPSRRLPDEDAVVAAMRAVLAS